MDENLDCHSEFECCAKPHPPGTWISRCVRWAHLFCLFSPPQLLVVLKVFLQNHTAAYKRVGIPSYRVLPSATPEKREFNPKKDILWWKLAPSGSPPSPIQSHLCPLPKFSFIPPVNLFPVFGLCPCSLATPPAWKGCAPNFHKLKGMPI